MAETWYYVDETSNAQQGPCTVPELGKLLTASSISDTTLVWRDGQAGWEALCSVSTLHAQVLAARGGPPALPAKALPPLPAKPRASGGSSGGGGAYAAAQASAPVVQSMSGEGTFVDKSLLLDKRRKPQECTPRLRHEFGEVGCVGKFACIA